MKIIEQKLEIIYDKKDVVEALLLLASQNEEELPGEIPIVPDELDAAGWEVKIQLDVDGGATLTLTRK